MKPPAIAKLQDFSKMRAAFQWKVPTHFNIAAAACDDWAEARPNQIAIRHFDAEGRERALTYGDLKRQSDALAAHFVRLGVGQGDRVAILLAQCPEVMVAHFAAYKLGAIVVPLFTLFGPDALHYRLKDAGAKVVITDQANAAKLEGLRQDLPDLSHVVLATPQEAAWREILSGPADIKPVSTLAEDPACLIYTSGTTGPPKGVLHAHRFLLGHLPAIECHHEGFPRKRDVGWTPADWAWIGGLMDLAMPCLYYGVPLISHRMAKFDPAAAWQLIAQTGASALFLPPTALRMMQATPVPDGVGVRTIGSGGESLGHELLGWGKRTLGASINELYGQTECNLVVSGCQAVGAQKDGTMGLAVPGTELAILDEAGQPLPAGSLGEICVKRGHPAMFLRYWNKPGKTRAKFHGDWMRTGDLGQIDKDGYVSFHARDDDVITASGYRVGPTEIENCLCADPDVAMAAVIGVPDRERTELIKAVIVLVDGAPSDELTARLQASVRARVGAHLVPRVIEYRSSLPLTSTGKIMRRQLRDEANSLG